MKLILASQSPRRKEILSKAGFVFDIIPSLYDEKVNGKNYTKELIENCAFNKALDVQKRIGLNFAILSADTVVVLDNLILGKPKDVTDASNILNSLSNKTHFVATSICVLYQDKIIKDTEITKVTFRKLSDYDIKNYIETKKPFDKAGSYAIQDEGFDFVVNIDGCYDNVVGLPLKLVEKHLSWLKIH